MNPYLFHCCIIGLLMLPGIATFFLEFFSGHTGGMLIQKYTFTKLYWLGFIGYIAVTTSIVLCVHLSLALLKKRFTKLSVFLSHAIPIGIVWISLSFGIHDFFQNMWKQRTPNKKNHLSDSILIKQERKPSMSQPSLTKQLPSQPSDISAQPPKQQTDKDPKN